MYVNYEYYRIFYQVAQCGSFTAAAQRLGGNQPNVTRAMNRLEDETGCTLFVRTNRGVRLTPEGEVLYEHVRAAMTQLQAGEQALTAARALEAGSVTVGASETALHLFLLEILRQFRLRHPGVRLGISNHSTPQAVQAVQDGAVDFAVVTAPTALPDGLREVPLTEFREVLVGGRAFAAAAAQPLALADLAQYPLIALGRGTGTFDFYRAFFAQHGLDFAPDTEAATADQLLPLVRYELGLAFMPEALAQDALRRGELVRFTLAEPIPPRKICLVYDPLHPQGKAAQALLHTALQAGSTEKLELDGQK